jgi:hypothetical protein
MKALLGLFAVTFLFQLQLNAQNIRPAGMNAYAGFGFSEYTIDKDGSNDFKMDRGVFATIAGERGFGFLNSYLTFTINLLKSSGNSNYSYTPLSGGTVTASNVSFDSNLFQFALGYKIKIFDGSWFRPYVEGGAVGGYYQIKYSISSVTGGDINDAKTSEQLFDSGYYAEAGFEIDFSSEFGLKVAGRQMKMTTADFETLGNSQLGYTAKIVFLSVVRAF